MTTPLTTQMLGRTTGASVEAWARWFAQCPDLAAYAATLDAARAPLDATAPAGSDGGGGLATLTPTTIALDARPALDVDSPAFRAAVVKVFEAPGEWGPAQGYYAADIDHFIDMLRAALAAPEETP